MVDEKHFTINTWVVKSLPNYHAIWMYRGLLPFLVSAPSWRAKESKTYSKEDKNPEKKLRKEKQEREAKLTPKKIKNKPHKIFKYLRNEKKMN